MERTKYAHDRLWDARKEAYTAIVAEVGATMRAADTVDQGFNDGSTHPESYFASDHGREQMSAIWDCWQRATSEFERSQLLLSDAFAARFQRLRAELRQVDDSLPPVTYGETSALLGAAFPDLMRIAKAEIAPPMA